MLQIDALARRLGRLRLAGTEIHAGFAACSPPVLPRTARLLRRWRDPAQEIESICWCNGRPGWYRLYWSDAGTFDLDTRRARVCCFLHSDASETAVEEVLRGPVCSFFLLERGFEPLHAGAVVHANQCFILVGGPGAGKSTLVAAFKRFGARFLCDDVLPLRLRGHSVRAYSGLPQLRLVSGSLRGLGWRPHRGWQTGSKLTVPIRASARRKSYPVTRIYLLGRRESAARKTVRVTPVSAREAFVGLVANTTNITLSTARRLRRQLRIFGTLAVRVPARQLSYPSGFRHLERLWHAILRDLAT